MSIYNFKWNDINMNWLKCSNHNGNKHFSLESSILNDFLNFLNSSLLCVLTFIPNFDEFFSHYVH
jgi:hypothetical protein